MSYYFYNMNDDLRKFLDANGVDDVNDFIQYMKENKICPIEQKIMFYELGFLDSRESEQKNIPVSKIIGCSGSNLSIDKSIFGSFSNFFDSKNGDEYHTRGLKLLNVPIDEIMNVLQQSFDAQPIKTISIGDDYYISSNGMHRFMLLKLCYYVELYQGKKVQELDEKYRIKVVNEDINVFKIFKYYLGYYFDLGTEYLDGIGESEWINMIKDKIHQLSKNPQDYLSFIANISYNRFIANKSGQCMIYLLNKYFPNITLDIAKYLCMNDNYECMTNILNCINNYFPNQTEMFVKIIKENC